MAGVILQDRETAADLEQASKFSSTNQNMCSDVVTWELTLESFRTENYSAKHTYAKLQVYENVFARTNSDSNILVTVEKTDRVDFLEEDCSTSTGFHDD